GQASATLDRSNCGPLVVPNVERIGRVLHPVPTLVCPKAHKGVNERLPIDLYGNHRVVGDRSWQGLQLFLGGGASEGRRNCDNQKTYLRHRCQNIMTLPETP